MCLCDVERNVQLGQEGVPLSPGVLRLTLRAATFPSSGQSSLFFQSLTQSLPALTHPVRLELTQS